MYIGMYETIRRLSWPIQEIHSSKLRFQSLAKRLPLKRQTAQSAALQLTNFRIEIAIGINPTQQTDDDGVCENK